MAAINAKELILSEARRIAQAHGYNGMNFRELADRVGIKPASIYHHFASKAELGAAVARRYWEDAAANLDAISAEAANPKAALARYPEVFRRSLENENRLCLGSFMSAEHDDLPAPVMQEVRTFTEINVAWLSRMLVDAGLAKTEAAAEPKARAIVASIAGAQLMARSRADITLFDRLVAAYQDTGLLPQPNP